MAISRKIVCLIDIVHLQAQKYLLGGIEKLIEMKRDLLLPKVAGIFKIMYDEDILEEEVTYL